MEKLQEKLNILEEEKKDIDKELDQNKEEANALIKEYLEAGISEEELLAKGFSIEEIKGAKEETLPSGSFRAPDEKNNIDNETEESWEQFQEKIINDKSLNYEETVKRLHTEYDRRKALGKNIVEETMKSPEEIGVDKARKEYVEEYLKCKKEFGKQIKIDNLKAGIFNIFKKKENKKHIKEEDYFTEEYKNKKEVYDQARVDYGNKLFNEKRAQLQASGLHGEELEKQMRDYKATEILTKTILDEHQKLIDAKAEGSPVNPSAWKALWNKYQKLPRWKKVAISTVIFATAASIGAGAVTGGVAGAAGYRFLRGMVSGTVAAHSAKTVDWAYEKGNEKFKASQTEKYNSLKEKFGAGEITQQEYEKESSKLKDEEKKRLRNQTLVKAGVGIAVGAGVGALAASEFGGVDNHSHDGIAGTNHQSDVEHSNTIGGDNKIPHEGLDDQKIHGIDDHKIIDAEVGKGHGAIKTLQELQDKLEKEYPDPTTRPPSIQHIIDTKADKLAMEYGMFKPGENVVNESALFKVGGKFEVDQSGNVSYQEAPGLKSTLLEKGTDLKASGVYEGKMFDSDHSGNIKISNENIENTGAEEIPQYRPEIIDNGTPIPATSDIEEIPRYNPETGLVDNNIDNIVNESVTAPPTNIDENLASTPKVKSGNIKEVINPSNPNWTPRFPNETGGVRPISPTGSNINTGYENVPGNNGFTREVPMTNQEANEFYGTRVTNPSEAITVREPSIMNDPRHLENADQVRSEFGRQNVIIDKPDENMVNGMRVEEWNKHVDQMFKQKGVEFDSYADYEKNRQLQEFFGKGIKGVEYDASLDKMVDEADMYYFKTDIPEWETVKTIPAKDFFDFNQSNLTDGSVENTEKLNNLIKAGIVEDKVSRSGVHNYSFTHEDELERLSKTYAKIDPLNANPIGNETMEKYIGRITRDLHKTDDGTLFMFKNENLEKSVDDGTFLDKKIEQQSAMRSRPSGMRNSSYTRGYYDPRTTNLASTANDIIGNFFGYSRWTH